MRRTAALVLLLLFLLLPVPPAAGAEDAVPPGGTGPEPVPGPRLTVFEPSSRRERLDPAVEQIMNKFDRDIHHLLSSPFRATPKDAAIAGLTVLGTLFLLERDEDILVSFAKDRGPGTERIARRLNNLGKHIPETVIGLYLAGYALDSPSLKSDALQGTEAMALTALFTGLSGYLVGHAGPDQTADSETFRGLDKYHSMPDVPTAMTFSLAGVLAHDRGVAAHLAFYGLAAGVAGARVHGRNAWPSDVFLGAVLGTVIGRTIPALSAGNNQVSLAPALIETGDGPLAGMMVQYRF